MYFRHGVLDGKTETKYFNRYFQNSLAVVLKFCGFCEEKHCMTTPIWLYAGLFGIRLFNSPFRLTSLIYAEKLEFENPTIMEDKQCKQKVRFSVVAKEAIIFYP